MDKQLIVMSTKELKQYDIIKKVINKELKGVEAAKLLSITDRHLRRLKKKVIAQGVKGLIHGNRSKPSNRRLPEAERQRIINLINKYYADFGPLLATEKLASRHNIHRHPSTIRNIMIAEGIWRPKQKQKKQYRSWRQRKASLGEMIQYDGSYEHWFENRGPKCCLLAAIDDATSKVWARFAEHEGVWPTFAFWQGYLKRFGKPNSIYVDKFSTYSMNHKLAKENPDTLTQFQRAMENDLKIEIIHAQSPAAKGRVERLFKTLQDRLIKEMRLNNISTIKQANIFLETEFSPQFNAKFMVEAKNQADLHQPLSQAERKRLNSIFSRQYERVVRNDFTVYHQKQRFQLLKEQPVTICKKDKVIVEEHQNGSIYFRLRGKYLNYQILPPLPKKIYQNRNHHHKSMWIIPKTINCSAIDPRCQPPTESNI
jgi:transposase-like protein